MGVKVNLLNHANLLMDVANDNKYNGDDKNVDFSDSLLRLHSIVCKELGVLNSIDIAMYKESNISYKDTIMFRIIKQVECISRSMFISY